MEKAIPCKWKGKKSRVAILTSHKIDFKPKDKEGNYIMIRGTVQQKDIIIINIYIPNM